MTGIEFLVWAAVVAVLALVIFAGWLGYMNVKLALAAHETNRLSLELIDKQAAIIASSDALTYQAIRAMDHLASYDDGSTGEDLEESPDGLGEYRDPAEAVGFVGDPFVGGTVFNSRE